MNKAKETGRSVGFDQPVQLPSSGIKLRQGRNVLPTSNPEDPATNPFVQARNQGSTRGKSPAHSAAEEIRRQAEDAVEKGRRLISKQKGLLSDVLEAGKQAYHEEKTKAE
jgi:hypothetical protein